MTNAPKPEDVYSNRTYASPVATAGFFEPWMVSVTLEPSPMALPRVFGLLGTLDVVPVSSRSVLLDQVVTVVLTFAEVRHSTVDRLYRKLQQLTETIEVVVGDDRHVKPEAPGED